MPKSIFSSQTVVSCLGASGLALFTFFSNPSNWEKAANCAGSFNQVEAAKNLTNAATLLTAALPFLGIVGRVRVGDLWTPKWLPGPDKNDVLTKQFRDIQLSQVPSAIADLSRKIDAMNNPVGTQNKINLEAKPSHAVKAKKINPDEVI